MDQKSRAENAGCRGPIRNAKDRTNRCLSGRTVLGVLLLTGLVALSTPRPAAAQQGAHPPVRSGDLSEEIREFVSVDSPVVAITGVRVVDGTGSVPMDDRTVLIENGRIAALGPTGEVEVPEDARVLERDGYTLIPGIVGLHNHIVYTTSSRWTQLSFSAPRLYLASGVTTVRTTGSFVPYSEINLKQEIAEGRTPGPTMYVTGPFLTGPTEDRWGQMSQIESPEDARRVVDYWAEEEVGWFKAYTRISRKALGAAIEEAHSHGLKFTGHLCSVTFSEAVELGIDNIEHGYFTNTGWYPEKKPDRCPSGFRQHLAKLDVNSSQVQATIQKMVKNEVALTSTLAVAEHSVPNRPPRSKLERTLDVMAPEVRKSYLKTRKTVAERGTTKTVSDEVFARAQAFEKNFHDAGGLLAAGVDPTGFGGALPGFGDQRNFELLVDAGFEPVEAIKVMTHNGARVLGVDDELGTVEQGKRADLVLIDGNPIENTSDIRNVTTVFKDGVGYDSGGLIETVRGVVGRR